MILKWCLIIALGFTLTSCLKTRSEVGQDEQSQIYSKKNADNQREAQVSQINSKNQSAPIVDERDELIRTLNGRVENLESQIASLGKEKTEKDSQETQKLQLLQEALAKMEAQIQKLESEQALNAAAAPRQETTTKAANNKMNSSDKNAAVAVTGSASTYDTAQDFFMKKEWKKAIFNYQKYVDESPKGKNVADSKYKIGVCFQELGMKEESMAFYEEVIANYAKTEAGKKAKMRLAKLKK